MQHDQTAVGPSAWVAPQGLEVHLCLKTRLIYTCPLGPTAPVVFAAVSMGFMAGNNSTSLRSARANVSERKVNEGGGEPTLRVGEEHDQTVDADTPPSSRGQTMLEASRIISTKRSHHVKTSTHASTNVSSIPCASSSPCSFCRTCSSNRSRCSNGSFNSV